MRIQVPVINAFIDGSEGGNPAGVVLDAEAFSADQKQRIAAQVGLSETAFVSPSTEADVKLEFFTPTMQIPHCGHATVATFSYLKQIGRLSRDQASKETIDGRREILMDGDAAYMEQLPPRYQSLSPEMYAQALTGLGIGESDLLDGAEPLVVNTGNSFLVVSLRSSDLVKQLTPDLALIEDVSERLDLIGFYIFSPSPVVSGRDAGARMFAPRYGINEESATGMAAGPLACYLRDKLMVAKTHFLIEQGHLMPSRSPSLINVRLETDDQEGIRRIFAGGRAAISEVRTVEI